MIGDAVPDLLRHDDARASAIDNYGLDRRRGAIRSPIDPLDLPSPTTPSECMRNPDVPGPDNRPSGAAEAEILQ